MVATVNKYVYHLLILNTHLKTSKHDYDNVILEDFVKNHLYFAVEATLETKRRLAQPKSWRLPVAVDYDQVKIELDCLSDGEWGFLGAGATILYLIQSYKWQGLERTSIFLHWGSTGLNPTTRPHHQLDAERMAIILAQKEAFTALETLKSYNVSLAPRLISETQTLLSLCCKPAVTLSLGTGLPVSRVQNLFCHSGLHYVLETLFTGNVDLLTRYNRLIKSKITEEFYSPAFLRPRLEDRAMTPVDRMKKGDNSHIPHKNP